VASNDALDRNGHQMIRRRPKPAIGPIRDGEAGRAGDRDLLSEGAIALAITDHRVP
jgi:hypothetical protein